MGARHLSTRVAPLYSQSMLANYARFYLVLEAAAYVAIAYWLHWLYGWGYAPLAAAALAVVVANRILMVLVSSAVAALAAEEREPAHRIGAWRAAAMVLREGWTVTKAQLYEFPFHRFALRADPPLERDGRMAVICAHGYYSNRGYFRAVVRALEARGVGPILTPNFPSIFAGIGEYAQALHAEIERACAATGAQQVALLCHSMGGVAAREYVRRHGAGRVAKLVTVATPHHGTLHAWLGAGANAREMRRASPFLRALREREGESGPGCAATSIYSTHDNLVAPRGSARLAWARNVAFAGRGHVELLSSPELVALVAEELRGCGERP